MSSETFYKDICQTIFEASGEGILVVKNDGSILMANRACEQMFGYDSGMLQNKNIDILIPDQLRKDYKNYINNFVKSTRKRAINKEIDLEVVKKDGTEISLDISLSSSLFEGEKVTIAFLRDMSARKNHFKKIQQTNEALIESNRKFDALINNLEDIVYRCKNDQDWTMEYISEGCENITGYSPKSFVNGSVHFRHIILAEDQEKVWSDTQKGIDNKKPFSLSYRIKNKKGAIKFMKEIGQGVFDDNGHLEAVEGFIRDVTAEKKKEFILKANKAKLKALLESNPDVLFIQNHEGVYLDWYANSPEKLFMPPEKFIGVNMKDVLAPHVYKKIKASHQKVIASGSMQIAEYSIEGKKEIEHYEARVVLMNNKKLLTIARNITDVKAQEALLKIRNDALASADNSILIADAKQPNTPIIYCNVAFLELTGYTENEVYGRDYNFLRDDERNQKEIDLMNKAIANGESCKVILRNYKKDGTLFWNEVAITPVRNENEELTHFISVQNDVSKRIKEEHLKNHIRQILELITQDKSLKTIGNKIIETAEEHFKGGIASILLLDKKTRKLHKLSAPNLPNAISQVIEGVVTGPEEGSSGTAAFLKKEIIITDIEHNIRCEKYKEIALKNEFKSCWAFPILSSTKQVLGTFSIYSSNKRGPLDSEQEIIRDMTYLASVAIEKHNNIKTLKESKKQLEYDAQKLE
jgi:PAS domain S-box-containing protein